MRSLITAIVLMLSIKLSAQNEQIHTKDILRVYDLNGKKFVKGRMSSYTETSLYLTRRDGDKIIPVSEIGSIQLNRSMGHDVLSGAWIGATALAVAGVFVADSESDLFEFYALRNGAVGGVIGFIGGAGIGGITYLLKKPKRFIINGDIEKWKTFTEMFSEEVTIKDTVLLE